MKVKWKLGLLVAGFIAGYVVAFGILTHEKISEEFTLNVEVLDCDQARNYLSSYLISREAISLSSGYNATSSESSTKGIRRVSIPLDGKHDILKVLEVTWKSLDHLEMKDQIISVGVSRNE